MRMKLRNVLIVVKDIEKSKQFYHELFGLDMVLDNDGNMILTEGLVLQEEKIWREFLQKEIIPENHSCELYFEERDIEAFVQKLEKLYPSVKYVNRLMTHSWGQKVIRFLRPGRKLDRGGNSHVEQSGQAHFNSPSPQSLRGAVPLCAPPQHRFARRRDTALR